MQVLLGISEIEHSFGEKQMKHIPARRVQKHPALALIRDVVHIFTTVDS